MPQVDGERRTASEIGGTGDRWKESPPGLCCIARQAMGNLGKVGLNIPAGLKADRVVSLPRRAHYRLTTLARFRVRPGTPRRLVARSTDSAGSSCSAKRVAGSDSASIRRAAT